MAVSNFIFNVWAYMANYHICIDSRVFISFQSSMANRFILVFMMIIFGRYVKW